MQNKKVGLALGGGGSLGFAHLGILKVLEKNKIPINLISGSSIGAVIGAHYCLFKDLKKLEADAMSFIDDNNFSLFDVETILQRKDKIKQIELFFEDIFEDKTFADCKIPFCCTALNLETGKTVFLDKGNIRKAVLASMSIPGVFNPVFYWGNWLVDGGFLDPVPIDYLEHKKCDVVIGVDLHPRKQKIICKSPKYIDVIQRTFRIFEMAMTDLTLDKCKNKIIIKPKYTLVKDLFSYETAKSYMVAGEKGALLQVKTIKQALDK